MDTELQIQTLSVEFQFEISNYLWSGARLHTVKVNTQSKVKKWIRHVTVSGKCIKDITVTWQSHMSLIPIFDMVLFSLLLFLSLLRNSLWLLWLAMYVALQITQFVRMKLSILSHAQASLNECVKLLQFLLLSPSNCSDDQLILLILNIQWNSVTWTSDNSKTCLTQTKLHGPCPIICWAYLELLVGTRTDKLWLVPSNYLFCGWMCLHSCVTSLISLFSFHTSRKSRRF